VVNHRSFVISNRPVKLPHDQMRQIESQRFPTRSLQHVLSQGRQIEGAITGTRPVPIDDPAGLAVVDEHIRRVEVDSNAPPTRYARWVVLTR